MKEENIYFAVYLGLIALTAATVGFYFLGASRTLSIVLAFTIASLKASLIAWYFMHLREEKAVVYGIVTVGLLAVAILAAGTFPDLSIFVR